jgi:hypothetical protein
MSAITVTAAKVAPAKPNDHSTVIASRIAAAAITVGQSLFTTTSNGKVDLEDTSSAGKQQFRGIALETVGAGQAVDVLERGLIEGYDLSGMSFDDFAYGQDTPGVIGTTAGTKTVRIGRVVPTTMYDSSGNIKKLLYVQADMINNW